MAECAECGKRSQASRGDVGLPTVVSGGVCPRCLGHQGVGIRVIGDRQYECRDPRCAFRWSECVGCGQ